MAKTATDIRVGNNVVGKLQPGERTVVQSINGEWVAVKQRTAGWVPGQNLIAEELALEYFNARIQKDPSDLSARVARARIWKDLSDANVNRAIGAWTESMRIDPQQGSAYLQRARLWRARQVPARAIADLEQAVKLQPFNVAAYQELAELYLERGEHRRAETNYNEVMRLRPWEAGPHADRGWAHFLAGNRAAAMFDYQIAQRLDPHDARTAYRIGLMHMQDKRFVQAKLEFDRAILLNPRLAEAYFARASLHNVVEGTDQPVREEELQQLALLDYRMAIFLSPQYAEAFVARAKLWQKRGEYDRALSDLSHIIALNPRQAQSYFDRGKIYLERSEGELALADFKHALEVEPDFNKRESETFVQAFRQRAEQRWKAQQFELAAADYSEAIAIAPENWDLLAARGQAYLAMKDYSRAVADLSEVASKRTEDPAAWFALAHAWYLAGQYGRAAVEYRKAILVEPNYVPAYTNLAWLLATCPDKQYRNGKLAVKYATYACAMTGWKQYEILDTLAAAQAEAGDYHEAIKIQSAVVYMSPPEQRGDFRARLALYGGLKPYREERAENSGINAESDSAGVLARTNDNSEAAFAKSLEMPLEDLEALAAENAAAVEAKEAAKSATATTDPPADNTEPTISDEPSEVAAVEPVPQAKAPIASEPLKKDDPAAIAALKKLGGRTSSRLTGELQSLGLQYTKFTDKDAALLDGVPNLEILDLTFTPIGEPMLKKLGSMKSLKLIVLDQTKITDDLLAHLADLPNLEVLSVKATTVSGKGLQHLQKLPKLNMILINGTRVTSSELKQMESTMPKVKIVR